MKKILHPVIFLIAIALVPMTTAHATVTASAVDNPIDNPQVATIADGQSSFEAIDVSTDNMLVNDDPIPIDDAAVNMTNNTDVNINANTAVSGTALIDDATAYDVASWTLTDFKTAGGAHEVGMTTDNVEIVDLRRIVIATQSELMVAYPFA